MPIFAGSVPNSSYCMHTGTNIHMYIADYISLAKLHN